jgi:hypothetical protein
MRYMHVCFRMGSMEKAFKELLDSVKVIYIKAQQWTNPH